MLSIMKSIFASKETLEMNMGVPGSGMAGQAIAARLLDLGHDVMIGTRDEEKLSAWRAEHHGVKVGLFAETASHGKCSLTRSA